LQTQARTLSRLGVPALGDGVGLRDVHFGYLTATSPDAWGVDWFEIISENFIDNHGYAAHVLELVGAHRPLVMHGVSLSIGSTAPLDRDYLWRLRALAERVHPAWISDHLCWTGVNGRNTHDLLPLPLTSTCLAHVADRVRAVQDWLGRPIVLENPSTYLQFHASQMSEQGFLGRLAEDTGCGLLLDVNNVYVSSVNHGFDPIAYIDALPPDRIVQVHLAGCSDCGGYLIDTHDHPSPLPMHAPCRRRSITNWSPLVPALTLAGVQAWMLTRVTAGAWGQRVITTDGVEASVIVRGSPVLSAEERLDIYARSYVLRLAECLRAEFPVLRALIGESTFDIFAGGYLSARPPTSPSLYDLGAGFAEYLDATRPHPSSGGRSTRCPPASPAWSGRSPSRAVHAGRRAPPPPPPSTSLR
jgi:uncharacterized protein (UPF0276 family)